jgi:hypothetical protein
MIACFMEWQLKFLDSSWLSFLWETIIGARESRFIWALIDLELSTWIRFWNPLGEI